ncbi:MAG: hypothetical protein U9P70_02510 [Patescibacteria group bacterium]|nr:hypothetical protein [Patescibacteria group bacterium]
MEPTSYRNDLLFITIGSTALPIRQEGLSGQRSVLFVIESFVKILILCYNCKNEIKVK